MGDAFAPWHVIILVIVLVLLFGARRLPGAAKSLGESMHIFKNSVSGLHDDQPSGGGTFPQAGSAIPPAVAGPATADQTQQQLMELQRQVAELQARGAASNGQPAETQTPQPL